MYPLQECFQKKKNATHTNRSRDRQRNNTLFGRSARNRAFIAAGNERAALRRVPLLTPRRPPPAPAPARR
ncbi:hypothetical protein EVAR_21731_1 [Eumeta japonica]|uniref:Uncharacterized protein n=1 Tax=Eumeta variegata TaxID=151549 RepID=A0A4C1W8V2_EUMVA|nr:hypothetical protein EVAR_21731_1 [Eumeta japonica]